MSITTLTRNLVPAASALSLFLLLTVRPALAQDDPPPDLSGNDPHWVKASNAACWVYSKHPSPGETVYWYDNSGVSHCNGGPISGDGRLDWYRPDGTLDSEVSGHFDQSLVQGQVTADFYPANGSQVTAVPDMTLTGTMTNGLLDGEATVTSYHPGGTTSSYAAIWKDGIFQQGESGDLPAPSAFQGVNMVPPPPDDQSPASSPPATYAQAQPAPAAPDPDSVAWDNDGTLLPKVDGAAPSANPAPPSIRMRFDGYGEFTFGMTESDAIDIDHALQSNDNSGDELFDRIVIDGVNYKEILIFSAGAVPELTTVELESSGQNYDSSDNDQCGTMQAVFDALTQKYGPSATVRDHGWGLDYFDYVWTFANGGKLTETVDETFGNSPCPELLYSAPQAAPKSGSF